MDGERSVFFRKEMGGARNGNHRGIGGVFCTFLFRFEHLSIGCYGLLRVGFRRNKWEGFERIRGEVLGKNAFGKDCRDGLLFRKGK